MSRWIEFFADTDRVIAAGKRVAMWAGGVYVTAYIVYSGLGPDVREALGFDQHGAAWFAFSALVAQAVSTGAARRMEP